MEIDTQYTQTHHNTQVTQ